MQTGQQLTKAYRFYELGDFSAAINICLSEVEANKESFHVYQLLAHSELAQNHITESINYFDEALRFAPDDVETIYQKGETVLKQGQIHAAAKCYKLCSELEPTHRNAAIRYGNYLLEQNNPLFALQVFENALKKHADHPTLMRGKLFALKDLRKFDAAIQLLSELGEPPDLQLTKGQLFVQKSMHSAAEKAFEQAISHPPTAVNAIRNLLQSAFMSGGIFALRGAFEKLERGQMGHEVLHLIGADVFKEAMEYESAFDCLNQFEKLYGAHPEADQIKASIYISLNDAKSAFKYASLATHAQPQNVSCLMRLSQAALMDGQFELALNLAQRGTFLDEHSSFWPAIEATAYRAMGRSEEYAYIMDFKNSIRVYEVDTPNGFSSLTEYLGALKEALLELHEWREQPLTQSVKGGTQTSLDLRFSDNSIIQCFFETIKSSINDYMSKMPKDANHPLYKYNTGDFYISGAWSVLLSEGGFHVNHIHPGGWISSAFYVDVPKHVEAAQDKKGWLCFGAPPFSVSGVSHELEICPKPGRLVLFPSYMWHGTNPLSENERQRRLTLPFDVRPSA